MNRMSLLLQLCNNINETCHVQISQEAVIVCVHSNTSSLLTDGFYVLCCTQKVGVLVDTRALFVCESVLCLLKNILFFSNMSSVNSSSVSSPSRETWVSFYEIINQNTGTGGESCWQLDEYNCRITYTQQH